jgi:hypothetical protein
MFEIANVAQAKAINNKLQPTEESFWRSVMREYSTLFHVPLSEVKNLDPEDVLLNVYEHQYESIDVDDDSQFNKLMNVLYKLEDPNFDEKHELEEQEANRKILEEEERMIAEKAAKKRAKLEAKKEAPKGGGINLSYLADSSNES